jgi:hypothetical protein
MKKIFYLPLILFFSCASIRQGSLEKTGIFSLHLPNTKKIEITETFIVTNNESSFLYILAAKPSRIEVIDLRNKKQLRTIPLEKNPNCRGLWTNGKDSILTIFENSNLLSVFNFEGKLLSSSEVNVLGREIFALKSMPHNKMLYNQGNVFLNVSYRGNSPLEIPLYGKDEIKYDLKTGTVSTFHDYPEIYKQKKWWHYIGYQVSKAIDEDENMLVSYPILDSIYLYKDLKFVKKVNCPSQYLKSYPFPSYDFEQRQNPQYKSEYVTTLGRYYALCYDPYQSLYYRLVLHPQKYTNADSTRNTTNDMPWSLIVLDKNLNILTEKYFEGKKYNYYTVFPTPEGLFVCNKHELNEEIAENEIQFTIFKFIEK